MITHSRARDAAPCTGPLLVTHQGEAALRKAATPARPSRQVLATGEDGSQYPVCCFVRPLQLGRRLANPRQAARFVGLLRRREDEEAAAGTGLAGLPGARGGGLGEMAECWCCLHTVLASGAAVKVGRGRVVTPKHVDCTPGH